MSNPRIPSMTLAIAAAIAMIGCGQKEEPKPVPNASLANVPPLNVNVPISTAPPERPAATLPKLTETKVTPPSKPVEPPTMTSKREVPAETANP